jgi:hypothetical protein
LVLASGAGKYGEPRALVPGTVSRPRRPKDRVMWADGPTPALGERQVASGAEIAPPRRTGDTVTEYEPPAIERRASAFHPSMWEWRRLWCPDDPLVDYDVAEDER